MAEPQTHHQRIASRKIRRRNALSVFLAVTMTLSTCLPTGALGEIVDETNAAVAAASTQSQDEVSTQADETSTQEATVDDAQVAEEDTTTTAAEPTDTATEQETTETPEATDEATTTETPATTVETPAATDEAATYTITLTATDGATFQDGSTTKTVTVEDGKTLGDTYTAETFPAASVPDGSTFEGWALIKGDTEVDYTVEDLLKLTITSDMTLETIVDGGLSTFASGVVYWNPDPDTIYEDGEVKVKGGSDSFDGGSADYPVLTWEKARTLALNAGGTIVYMSAITFGTSEASGLTPTSTLDGSDSSGNPYITLQQYDGAPGGHRHRSYPADHTEEHQHQVDCRQRVGHHHPVHPEWFDGDSYQRHARAGQGSHHRERRDPVRDQRDEHQRVRAHRGDGGLAGTDDQALLHALPE